MVGIAPKDKLFTFSFVVACIGNFLLFMGFYMLLPVLPLYLIDKFAATKGEVGIVLACYTVAALAVRPFSGYLADRFDRKPVYILAYTFFALLFFSYPLVQSVLLFALMRIFHGLAFGMVSTAGNTLIIDIMPASRRGEGLGYFGIANNVAMATGPMVGLMLHESTGSFNTMFYAALSCGLLGLLFASRIRSPKKQKLDSGPLSWDRFFLKKGLKAGLCLLLLAVPYGMTTSYMPLYAAEIGITANTGYFFSLMAIGLIFSRMFAGTMVDRGRITQVISVGIAVVMVAFSLFASLDLWGHAFPFLAEIGFFSVAVLLGIGYGMLFPACNTLFVNLAPNNRRATASSTYLTSWDVGIGVGLVFGGNIGELKGFSLAYFIGAFLVGCSLVLFMYVVTPHYMRNKYR